MPRMLVVLLGVLAALAGCNQRPERRPLVLAAASLQEALTAAADAWAAEGHVRPTLSFAASSTLARQIESGANADLFIAADTDWMESVERSGHLAAGTRRNLVGNALVVVAPPGGIEKTGLEPGLIDQALGRGRLAMADPESVPAGRYGKAALQSLGLWPSLDRRITRSENVRAALALVERGETPLGIVYATDAEASGRVRVVAALPPSSYPPIVYPMALLAGSGPQAAAFHRFLLSPRGQAIFTARGFTNPPPR